MRLNHWNKNRNPGAGNCGRSADSQSALRLPVAPTSARRAVKPVASRRAGFTLVELLLVLVILGILAAIVLPRFTNRTKQAQVAATQTQIATFKTALDAYEVDNGYYPKGRNGLLDLIQQPRDAQNWRGPYIQSDAIPKDPWGNDYSYECPGRHNPTSYDLSSPGPPGENMVIGNWTVKR